jgi:hypothetical protein
MCYVQVSASSDKLRECVRDAESSSRLLNGS